MLGPYSIIIVLIFAMALFIWGYWRYDVVAILALLAAVVIGAVPFNQVFTGLSNPAVITVACVMIISQAIRRSGSIDFLVKKITYVTQSITLHIALLSIITAALSAFMNNVGALALMMPIAIQTATKNKRSPALVLMPIALASALGGLTTLIGTPPNLLVSAYRQSLTGQAFAMFSYSPVGICIAIIGIIFIALLGWRLIPGTRKAPKQVEDLFQIQDYLAELKIPNTSNFVDKTVGELLDKLNVDFELIGMIRNKRKKLILPPHQLLMADDILIVEANPRALQEIIQNSRLELVGGEKLSTDILHSRDVALMEAVVPPGARVENRSSKTARLRARYHINLLALAREGKRFRERLNDVSLSAGDVVLLQGPADSLKENAATLGFLPLVERGIQVGITQHKWLPLIIFVIAILAAAIQLIPVQIAFAAAVLAMIISRSIPTRLIYDSIEWPIIILLAAMIPVGKALQTTGGTALISHIIILLSKNVSPVFIIGLLLVITMTLSDFMNNAATAVVMAPIAGSVSQAMQASPDPFLMAVAIGASCSFLTPVGHQNNTLVMGPGGYKFTDYIRVGLPLELIIVVLSLPLIMWIWPL